jgi:hypothetical protein
MGGRNSPLTSCVPDARLGRRRAHYQHLPDGGSIPLPSWRSLFSIIVFLNWCQDHLLESPPHSHRHEKGGGFMTATKRAKPKKTTRKVRDLTVGSKKVSSNVKGGTKREWV